ncbi:MAG: hypothetical protein ETSY1_42565 [Candidatus Entotheonella factor]|uniref:Uncharacterized protein n=1 Tax=Entotheonella factor TaxID=1429438 RepID=W4L457_ENTF1|nr:MAG: hypothetical protein ETSY1_42565 [Candidatus Entotheonella factor]
MNLLHGPLWIAFTKSILIRKAQYLFTQTWISRSASLFDAGL